MHRQIQIVSEAFSVNGSHSNNLNLAVYGSWDLNPQCGAAFKPVQTHLSLI